jgi:hypothetical protein
MQATAAGGFYTTGSPFVTTLAPAYAFLFGPATQTDGGRGGTLVPYTVAISNRGINSDTYALSATNSAGWAVSFFDATCTTPLATTPSVASATSTNVCVKVAVPAGTANATTSDTTVTATSTGNSATATVALKTIAIAGGDTLLVDNDDNGPDVQGIYKAALDANSISYLVWDLKADKNLPMNYTRSFKNIVWFTGNSYPAPITPYEPNLKAFLDNGGRLFLSGQDLLDQAAGTTPFVHDYLHVTWDGTETQNDKPTANIHEIAGTLTAGLGTVPLNHAVLGGATFEDRITPNGTATAIFDDDTAAHNGLSYSGTYKVVFLAFPFEGYGAAAQQKDLLGRAYTFFGP